MAESRVSLKLLIDTRGQRVLFAEAGKDFVDFLFRILSLPVGTVISLLREQKMAGSLANLYQSVEKMNDSYLQPNQTKDSLLKPVHAVFADSSVPLLTFNDAAATAKKFYKCSNCYTYFSDDPRVACPSCRRQMTSSLSYVVPPAAQEASSGGGEGGIVKGVVTYMVMDDLVVTPMSTISSITLLNKFNVKDVTALQEKVVHLGKNEVVKLLSASLQSQNVLTDVFLKNATKLGMI